MQVGKRTYACWNNDYNLSQVIVSINFCWFSYTYTSVEKTKINVWKKDFFYLMFPFYTSKNTLPIGIYKGKIWHPLYIWKFSELLAKFFTTNICVLFISFVIPVDFFFLGCELKPRAIKQWGGYFKTEKLDFFNSSEWM